jgi:hypothetical protein
MNVTGLIENPKQIRNHQANTSTSKNQWSFSKSSRFRENKGYTATISYNLPSSSSRKASIGVGNRSNYFDDHLNNPAPVNYDKKSDFSSDKNRRGFSFTNNRDEIKYANYLNQLEHTPSPYALVETQTKTTRAYSMRPKTAYPKNCNSPLIQTSSPTTRRTAA